MGAEPPETVLMSLMVIHYPLHDTFSNVKDKLLPDLQALTQILSLAGHKKCLPIIKVSENIIGPSFY